jgi:hypothetical protein
MPADGFTKVLSKQKHIEFTRQLGLEDITKRLLSLHNCQDLCTGKVTWTRVYSLDRSLPLLGSD